MNEFLRLNKFFYKIAKSCLYIKAHINDINILLDLFRINKIILWVPNYPWVNLYHIGLFFGSVFKIDVYGFLRVGYKLGWVICGLGWAGLFYPTLTSLNMIMRVSLSNDNDGSTTYILMC